MKQLHKNYWKISDWCRKGCEATQILNGFCKCTVYSSPITATEIQGAVQQVTDRQVKCPCILSWLLQLLFQKGKGHICHHLTNIWATLRLFKLLEMLQATELSFQLEEWWSIRHVSSCLLYAAAAQSSWLNVGIYVMLFQALWDIPHGLIHLTSDLPALQLLGICGAPGVSDYLDIWSSSPMAGEPQAPLTALTCPLCYAQSLEDLSIQIYRHSTSDFSFLN